MKQSLTGLFRNTATALRQSPDELACAMAFCLGQLVDNLRLVKNGEATIEQFFECYVFDAKDTSKLADSVKPDHYVCMRGEDTENDKERPGP